MTMNLLPNPSFEDGWWHPDGIPELQVALDWDVMWNAGANEIDPDWDFVRPECRILPVQFLPPHEQILFVLDGTHTNKVFKGFAPIWFDYFTKDPIVLPPGVGLLTMNVYPDLVMGYEDNGGKIWATDPMSGRVSPIGLGADFDEWMNVEFGTWNTVEFAWEQDETTEERYGISCLSPHPLNNNGWWFDDLWLTFAPYGSDRVWRVKLAVPKGYDNYQVDLSFSGIGTNK